MEGAHGRGALAGSDPFMPRKALAAARAVLRFAREANDECGLAIHATRGAAARVSVQPKDQCPRGRSSQLLATA